MHCVRVGRHCPFSKKNRSGDAEAFGFDVRRDARPWVKEKNKVICRLCTLVPPFPFPFPPRAAVDAAGRAMGWGVRGGDTGPHASERRRAPSTRRCVDAGAHVQGRAGRQARARVACVGATAGAGSGAPAGRLSAGRAGARVGAGALSIPPNLPPSLPPSRPLSCARGRATTRANAPSRW